MSKFWFYFFLYTLLIGGFVYLIFIWRKYSKAEYTFYNFSGCFLRGLILAGLFIFLFFCWMFMQVAEGISEGISKEKIRWQGKSPCDCIHFAYTLDENEKNLSYSYSEMPFWTKHPCGAIMELEEKWINGKHRTLFRGDTLKYIHDTSNVNPIKNDTLFTLLMLYGCISND